MPYCGRRARQCWTDAVLPAPFLPECDDLLCRGRLKSHPFVFSLHGHGWLLCCLLVTTPGGGQSSQPAHPPAMRVESAGLSDVGPRVAGRTGGGGGQNPTEGLTWGVRAAGVQLGAPMG